MAYQPLKLTVTLETVTPLFLGGAEPRGAPELRAPPFRGALRYWLRAALGGVLGDQNAEALYEAESTVFGSISGVSAVEVQVINPGLSHRSYNPLPHKRTRFQFKGFDPSQSFDLILVRRRANVASWRAAVGALLLTVALGGLGRRSRRGFGSLRVRQVDISQAQLPETWQELVGQVPTSATGWERYLKNVLQAAYAEARGLVKSLELPIAAPSTPSRFPLLDSDSEIMLCHRVFTDWRVALKAFGQAEHEFRRQNPRAKAAFGSANPRWASPLWVRVLPVSGGVVLALTLIWSQPPPCVRANRNDLRTFVKRCADEWDGRWLVRQEVAR